MQPRKLILVDGNAILHRAFHAYPLTLTTQSGELTNAVYGFTSTLLTVFKKFKPTHTIVTFDAKGKTFRHEQYDGYKASRPKMDDSLVCQIERTYEVVQTLNIPMFVVPGFEADDILGTLAMQAQKNHLDEVIIVTGDRDALQLITDKIHVYFPQRGKQPDKLFNEDEFIKQYQFKPKQLIDFKALAGDSSDEIPGVKGVGPKAATSLIMQFGSVEEIYNHLDDISNTLRVKLDAGRDMAYLSKQLATINTQAPAEFIEKDSMLCDYDKEKAIKLFTMLEFKSLANRLPDDSWEELVGEAMADKKPVKDKEKKEDDKQMKLF